MKPRGFGYVELVVALSVAAAGAALAAGIYWHGRDAGRAEVQAKWDREKLAAAKLERDRAAERAKALLLEMKRSEAAQAAADEWARKWRAARNEARRNGRQLASCTAPVAASPGIATSSVRGPDAQPGGGGVRFPSRSEPGSGAPGVRFHWRFVGLHDGRYTGADGEPLFRAQAEFAAAPERADTPSPYGPDELLDVHDHNAGGYSACLAWVDDTLRKLNAAEVAWEAGSR